ncbi:MAG: 1-(5-phosphoribosyl)-5-[Oscillospiraceae bacterium]|nr:1-(5-phosphoribosyl)-5-[(5-phosphoribosylamino)methylideneamino]imidazole-4-carboxamide isomerase [Oscillospiraceae bacterium]
MILLPAIDLYEGKAVRLYKGNYDEMTVYSDDPAAVAADFAACGAEWAHLVDLEGARTGRTPNFETVCRIRRESGLKCEVGGGIRSMAVIERYLAAGLDRVILGTAAVADGELLRRAAARFGGAVAVGADVRDGIVAVRGWTESSGVTLEDFCGRIAAAGVRTVICTDISRDGAMRGANRELYRRLAAETGLDVIASGGVSSLDDVRALAAMGLYGAIVGKAYYTGAVDLRTAIGAAK